MIPAVTFRRPRLHAIRESTNQKVFATGLPAEAGRPPASRQFARSTREARDISRIKRVAMEIGSKFEGSMAEAIT